MILDPVEPDTSTGSGSLTDLQFSDLHPCALRRQQVRAQCAVNPDMQMRAQSGMCTMPQRAHAMPNLQTCPCYLHSDLNVQPKVVLRRPQSMC